MKVVWPPADTATILLAATALLLLLPRPAAAQSIGLAQPISLAYRLDAVAVKVENSGSLLDRALFRLDKIMGSPVDPVGPDGKYLSVQRQFRATELSLLSASRRLLGLVPDVLGTPDDPVGPDGEPVLFSLHLEGVRFAAAAIVDVVDSAVPALPPDMPALKDQLDSVQFAALTVADTAQDTIDALAGDCLPCSQYASEEECEECEPCFWVGGEEGYCQNLFS